MGGAVRTVQVCTLTLTHRWRWRCLQLTSTPSPSPPSAGRLSQKNLDKRSSGQNYFRIIPSEKHITTTGSYQYSGQSSHSQPLIHVRADTQAGSAGDSFTPSKWNQSWSLYLSSALDEFRFQRFQNIFCLLLNLHTSINMKLYDIVVTHSDWSTAECPCPAFLSHKHSNPRGDLGHQPDPLALRVQMGYF